MLDYRFKTSGEYTGDVTGIRYVRTPDAIVQAPEGEFKRLGGADVEIVQKKKKKVLESDG